MESAGYLTYRAKTPMVIVRALRRIQDPEKTKSVLFEFVLDGGDRKIIRLPANLIDIWRYQGRGKQVLEVELPKALAEKIGLSWNGMNG